MQGFWSATETAGASFSNSWYFHATGKFSEGQDWWIYDATTHESSPFNLHDLSQWAIPNSEVDSDHDGLPDWFETLIGTNPHSPDSDGDGLPDWWEVQQHLNPNSASDKNALFGGSALTNYQEYQREQDPALADTDGDGIDDQDEITMGLDPLHPFVRPDPSVLSLEINLILE
jgi:hypothetical protein